MNAQEKFWQGEFGNAYTARNRVDWRKRIPFWKNIIEQTGARSVYEFGCNAGWNLSAIQRVDPLTHAFGSDINRKALDQAMYAGVKVVTENAEVFPSSCELVFTAGVLIHIAPENISDVMQRLINASSDYVLAIEYAADQEEEVNYRGHSERLWRRPYGNLYRDMGLTTVDVGHAGEGFDNCTYWLLRKEA